MDKRDNRREVYRVKCLLALLPVVRGGGVTARTEVELAEQVVVEGEARTAVAIREHKGVYVVQVECFSSLGQREEEKIGGDWSGIRSEVIYLRCGLPCINT